MSNVQPGINFTSWSLTPDIILWLIPEQLISQAYSIGFSRTFERSILKFKGHLLLNHINCQKSKHSSIYMIYICGTTVAARFQIVPSSDVKFELLLVSEIVDRCIKENSYSGLYFSAYSQQRLWLNSIPCFDKLTLISKCLNVPTWKLCLLQLLLALWPA